MKRRGGGVTEETARVADEPSVHGTWRPPLHHAIVDLFLAIAQPASSQVPVEMSSGDPLVDQEAQRLEALNNMLDSLASKDTLVLEAAVTTTANGDDPLVDAEEEARKKRNDMINSLSGKGNGLMAANADDPLVAQDNQRESERDQLIQSLQDKSESLLAQQESGPKTVEEALREISETPGGEADTNLEVARRAAEADSADRWLRMEANEANRRMEAAEPAAKSETSGFGLPDFSSWFKKDDKKEEGGKETQLSATVTNNQATDSGFGGPDVSAWSTWFKKDNKKDAGETDRQLSSTETDGVRIKLEAGEADRRHHALEGDEADLHRRALEGNEADRRHLALEGDDADRRRIMLEAAGQDWQHTRLSADEADRFHLRLEADGTDRSLKAARPFLRELAASGHSAHSSALDIPQMFGGAFMLVAVVALVAVVRRRHKPTAAPEPVDTDRSDGYDYQLFL